MAVLFLPNAQRLLFIGTGVIGTKVLADTFALPRGGATSYRGASPTLRVVFLWMFSKMF